MSDDSPFGPHWTVIDAPALRLSGGVSPSLSPAEREVAAALLRGATNAEIAERRGVAKRTVTKQVAAIFEKLGVRSRRELLTLAAGLGE